MVQKIVQQEGDHPDQPAVIKSAFTGCAANNIEAYTLHSAFGFNFANKYLSMSDQTRDQKRTNMKNLVMVIIDEISMVKPWMLAYLDERLKEAKQIYDKPFGGVAVIMFGDFDQQPPIGGIGACQTHDPDGDISLNTGIFQPNGTIAVTITAGTGKWAALIGAKFQGKTRHSLGGASVYDFSPMN